MDGLVDGVGLEVATALVVAREATMIQTEITKINLTYFGVAYVMIIDRMVLIIFGVLLL